ncbi:MAG: hypothetical protein E2O79_11585 [Caldithrix sp.]|nr:MAG: hypothetical protein E2O79_11585 [Caldithrix sp.]
MTKEKCKRSNQSVFIQRIVLLHMLFGMLAADLGCAGKGLLAEKYPGQFYRVSKLGPNELMNENPQFIVYGDARSGWRLEEKFLLKRNWLTWKMLIFPFYELYWLGNGFVGGFNVLRRKPDYGIRERRMVRDGVYNEAKRSKVDFILNTGDMLPDGRRPSHWAGFLQENKSEQPLLVDFPHISVIGNHERGNDSTYGLRNYEAVFGYPRFFVRDFQNAALFILDSNVILDQYHLLDDDKQDELFQEWFYSGNPEQPAWLERELAARDKTFKMVAMHHPPISFNKHHGDWEQEDWGNNLQEKRRQLIGLFQEQGVQIVFSGHEHVYEHNVVRYNLDGNLPDGEIHFIVSGGAGVPLRDATLHSKMAGFVQNYRDQGFDARSLQQEKVYHYCLVEINHDRVKIEAIEVTGDPAQPSKSIEQILIRE